ncbi:MAG: hypothetical protein RRA94_08950 [Bacteroidota bacterium]|nr:hypothetical protein [Bacteroidota bacterium]
MTTRHMRTTVLATALAFDLLVIVLAVSNIPALRARFGTFDTVTNQIVGFTFLLFGIYVLLRHHRAGYAGILHALAVGTAVMILLDPGSLTTGGTAMDLALRLCFDVAIWLLPALFFHFSFIYPVEKDLPKRLIMFPWYLVSAAGVALSAFHLAAMHFAGVPGRDTPYMEIHGTYNDVFLIVGLLCTIANFEHSALTIPDPVQRKNAYWVLLGIMAGPLLYVLMMLVPRMLLGHELVNDSTLQYTLFIAPLMFWKALRRSRPADVAHKKRRV